MSSSATPHPAVEAGSFAGHRALGGERYAIHDPGRPDHVVGYALAASAAEVDEVVSAAVRVAPQWAAMSLDERIELLRSASQQLVEAAQSNGWDEVLTSEQGKVRAESAGEVLRATRLFGMFAEQADAALRAEVLEDERGRREVDYPAIGPVAAITPWNWPVLLSFNKILPALLAGNPVILKPAPNTPLTVTAMAAVLARALPDGVLGVLVGGGDVGAALVSHADIRKVVFTGSIANGRRVYAAAADGIRSVTLELGGNDPAVVLEDAGLDAAQMSRIAASAFITSGQVCWAIKRIYVHERRMDEFVEAFKATTASIRVGHGSDPEATLGPLNNALQLEHVTRVTTEALAGGAQATALGSVLPSGGPETGGYFLQPQLVSGVDERSELVRAEQFGPVLPVLGFRDTDDVVARANDTGYGLCASVWSADRDHGFDVGRRLAAGQVFVNGHAGPAFDYAAGIGGIKQSGVGRAFGTAGLRSYTEPRVLSDRILR